MCDSFIPLGISIYFFTHLNIIINPLYVRVVVRTSQTIMEHLMVWVVSRLVKENILQNYFMKI